jgi:hypothetical protein
MQTRLTYLVRANVRQNRKAIVFVVAIFIKGNTRVVDGGESVGG